MSFTSWLRSITSVRPTGRASSCLLKDRYRRLRQKFLRFELLEDRALLAQLQVSSPLDDGSAGTLRWAIGQANATAGPDDIVFDPAVFGGSDITIGLRAELSISDELTISGPGAHNLAVSGFTVFSGTSFSTRVFHIQPGVTASISDLTIKNGNSNGTSTAGIGGGIFNEGTLTVSNSVLAGNRAYFGDAKGGGIYNTGTLTVRNTEFTGRTGLSGPVPNCFYGGGLYNAGTATVIASTFSGNDAAAAGGAIFNTANGNLTVANSTFSGNSARAQHSPVGGAIANLGTLAVVNSTIVDNYVTSTQSFPAVTDYSGAGGGIYNAGALTIGNTIIATNSAPSAGATPAGTGPDVFGVFTSNGHNLVGIDSGSSGFGTAGDQVGTDASPIDPRLRPLDYYDGWFAYWYGGAVRTMPLLSDSPALDAGSNALAVDGAGNPLSTDQRGHMRVVSGTVDIGAVENPIALSPPGAGATALLGVAPINLGSFTDANPVGGPWTVTVNWGDGSADSVFFANPGALGTPAYVYAAEGTYTATVTVTDSVGDARQTSFDVQVDPLTSPGLQALLATTPNVTIYADSTTDAADVVQVLNDLTGIAGQVNVTLDLGGATFAVSDLMYNPVDLASVANVNFVIQNGRLVSASTGLTVKAGILTVRDCTLESAGTTLTVNGGSVTVRNCTLLTTGNSPTVQVNDGWLYLGENSVQESTAYDGTALSITGGEVSLDSNLININGTGLFVQNSTANPVIPRGDTFLVNDEAPPLIPTTFTVTNTNDTGVGSLRQALFDAMMLGIAEVGRPTVTFAIPTSDTGYDSTTGQYTIMLAEDWLDLEFGLNLVGPAADSLVINGESVGGIFFVGGGVYSIYGLTASNGNMVNNATTLVVTDCTFTNGSIDSWSESLTVTDTTFTNGGISNSAGTLTVINSVFADYSGTGIVNSGGTLTVEGSTFSGNLAGGISSTSGTVTVSNSMFAGNAAEFGGGISSQDGALTVTGSTFIGNSAAQNGGGISFTTGNLTVVGSTFTGNSAALNGGGISSQNGLETFVSRTFVVTDSTFSGNSAGANGGGIHNTVGSMYGSLLVSGSTFSANTATQGGGALATNRPSSNNAASVHLMVVNSTFSGNTGQNSGGIRFIDSSSPPEALASRLINVTIAGNSASVAGGVFSSGGSRLRLSNSIVAGNVATIVNAPRDVTGAISNGHNLIGVRTGFIPLPTDRVGTSASPLNALLAPLGDYGAPTQTMPPLPGSPALNAGSNALAVDADGNPLTTDSRGFHRVANGIVDIGAAENQVAVSAPTPTAPVLAGVVKSINLGAFATFNQAAAPWTVTVDWGDATTTSTFQTSDAGALGQLGHSFAEVGDYTVTVTVADTNGDTGRATFSVPVAAVSIGDAPETSEEGTRVALTAVLTGLADGFTHYWYVTASNGQEIADGFGPAFSFIPTDNGTYQVTLTTTDQDQASATTTATIVVTDVPPIVAIHGRRDGLMGQTLKYTLTAFDPSSTDTAAGFSYEIDWDGNGSGDQTVSGGGTVEISQAYPQPGDYVMRVRAIGAGNVVSNQEQMPIAIGWTTQLGALKQTIDKINGSTVDAAGNLYVVGEVSHNLPGFTNNAPYGYMPDAFIRKYDSAGNVVWTRQFGSQVAFSDHGNHDVAKAVAVDANGIAYVVGHTVGVFPGQTKTTGYDDVFIQQVLDDGMLGWVRQFGSSGVGFTGYSDTANAVAVDATGVYLAGVAPAALPGQPQPRGTSGSAFVRKYSLSGTEVWTNQFGSNYSRTEATGIATDGVGSVYLVGFTDGTIATSQPSAGGRDAFVRHYSATGSIDWTRQFGTSSFDAANGVTVDASGVYVTGSVGGVLVTGEPAGGGFVRKFRTNGSTTWTRQFGGLTSEQSLAIATNGDGTIYTVGVTGAQTTAGGSMITRSFSSDSTAGWTRTYGDSNSVKIGRAVAVGRDGVYIAGQTALRLADGNGSGYIDAEIRKYDTAGNESWTRQFTSFTTGSREDAKAIVTDATGNIYIAGTTDGLFPGQTSGGSADWFLGKYSPNGTRLWTRQLGNYNSDWVGGLAIDASGAIYVAGDYGSNNNAQVRKFDGAGKELWSRDFGSTQADSARGIAVDASGSVYVSGFTRGAIPSGSLPANTYSGGEDAFVSKLRSGDGVVLWTSQFGTTVDDRIEVVVVDASGSIVVSGSTLGALPGQTNAGDRDAFVRKLNADGTVVWTRQFGTGGWDGAAGLSVDPAGSIYVGGATQGLLDPQAPASGGGFVRKYTSAGSVVWTRQITGGWNDEVYGLAADATGVYVAGSTDGELTGQSSSGGRDAYVLKYNSSGALAWTRQWGTGSSDEAFGVAAAAPDKVFVVATSDGVFPNGPIYQDQDIVVAQFRVSVPDPTVAGRNYNPLTITGTAGDDLIVLDPGTLTNSIRVTINGTEFGTFQYPRGIMILGGLGNDTIVVNTIAATSATLDGQAGSDVYITNLQGVRGLLRISDTGATGEDRRIVNATADADYVDKRGSDIKWWLRGNSPEANPANPPAPLATITSTGVEKTTIQLGDGDDYIIDPGEDTELIGGRGEDTFVITETTGTGIRIEDRAGTTEIVLELGGLAGPVTIDIEQSLSPVRVSIIGTDGVDDITITESGLNTAGGAIVNFVGIVGELAIDLGNGADIVTLDNLGESFTIYDVVADDGGDLSEVQIIGSPPPELTVNGNHAPRADAGGPYTIGEGGSLVLDASLSTDSDEAGDTLTYEWDFDGDGQYDDATGVSPIFPAAGLDGPTFVMIGLRVTDAGGLTDTAIVRADVTDVPPTISLSGDADVNEGDVYTLHLGNVTDPGQDTITKYMINWGDGTDSGVINGNPANTVATHTFADGPTTRTNTVTVTDEDGTFLAGSLNVIVKNVAPTGTLQNNGGVIYGNTATASFGDIFDPSAVDTAAGLRYAFSLDTDSTGSVTYATAGTVAAADFGVINAGSHTVYARIFDKDGGVTPYTKTLEVNQAHVSVKADAQTKVYDNNPTTDPALTYAAGTLITGNSFSGSLTRDSGQTVGGGPYAIWLGSLSAGSNYIIDYTGAEFTITKASSTATVSIGGGPFTYAGSALTPATVTVTGAGGLSLTPEAIYANNTNAGTATASYFYAGDENHFGSDDSKDFTIAKATPTITVTPYSVSYDGLPHTATGSAIGVDAGGAALGTSFNLSGTSHSGVGIYSADVWSFSGGTNYNNASGTVTDKISLATGSAYILNMSASGAVTASGNAIVSLPAGLFVNSNSPTAVVASGNANINVGGTVQVVGGVSKTGNANVTKTGTPVSTNDPLASLSAPSLTGLTNYGAVSVAGNSSATLNPGIYSSIQLSGNAVVNMNPGTYIILGGGFTVSGKASVSGAGITIFNAGSSYNGTTDGGNFGGIALSGSGNFNLAPPTSGAYAGILIYQSRVNTRALSISGNATVNVKGAIYAANAQLTMSGNGNLNDTLVVNSLNVSGNVALTQLASGSDTFGDSGGIANTLLAGNLTVYVGGGFSTDMLARVQDAISSIDTLLVPYNVTITTVSDLSLASIVLNTAATSASGTAANGVLGSYDPSAYPISITLLQGWDWYAGSDPSEIGADQYDFQTSVVHEIGHALGLGHSTDSGSPMNAMLSKQTASRNMTVADLNVPSMPDGVEPLMAEVTSSSGLGQSAATVAINFAAGKTQLDDMNAPLLVTEVGTGGTPLSGIAINPMAIAPHMIFAAATSMIGNNEAQATSQNSLLPESLIAQDLQSLKIHRGASNGIDPNSVHTRKALPIERSFKVERFRASPAATDAVMTEFLTSEYLGGDKRRASIIAFESESNEIQTVDSVFAEEAQAQDADTSPQTDAIVAAVAVCFAADNVMPRGRREEDQTQSRGLSSLRSNHND